MSATPMPKVSNEEFLRVTHGEHFRDALVCSFKDDPSNIKQKRRSICWHVKPFGASKLITCSNQYFCISSFHPDEQGRTKRRKALFKSTHVLCLDDVLEKLPIEQVNRLPQPTYKLQTSPGSIQYGYVLDTPCTEAFKIDNLHDGLLTKGLAPNSKDPGMRGTTRLMRLPEGVNTKASRVTANGGTPPDCIMLEWNPTIKVTLEDLALPFDIDLNAVRREQRVDGATNLPDHPLLKVSDTIHVKSVLSGGRYDIACPWVDEHTNKADDGAVIFTNNDGSIGFKCHHGSCQGKSGKHLLDLIEFRHAGFRKKLETWKVMKTFRTISAIAPTLDFMGTVTVEDKPLAHNNELAVVRGCDIKPEPIEWLWPGWLAVGKFHILAGSPGTGKTTIAISIAAILTKGGKWPDGTTAPAAEIALWSGEDDLKDTLAPRLLAARANMNKVHFIQGVNLEDVNRHAKMTHLRG